MLGLLDFLIGPGEFQPLEGVGLFEFLAEKNQFLLPLLATTLDVVVLEVVFEVFLELLHQEDQLQVGEGEVFVLRRRPAFLDFAARQIVVVYLYLLGLGVLQEVVLVEHLLIHQLGAQNEVVVALLVFLEQVFESPFDDELDVLLVSLSPLGNHQLIVLERKLLLDEFLQLPPHLLLHQEKQLLARSVAVKYADQVLQQILELDIVYFG